MYRNYIFDLYGTLVDIKTDEYSLNFWRRVVSVFAKGKVSYTPGELMTKYRKYVRRFRHIERLKHPTVKYIDIDLLDVFERLYRDKGRVADGVLLMETARLFRSASTEYIRLYDGVEDLLGALKAADKNIYLLSNAQESFTVPELMQLGIADYFDGIMISSIEKLSKPQKQFYDRLFERYGLEKSECIMIGNDQYSDIAGANAAGIDSLYIYQQISPPVTDEQKINAKWKIMDGDVRKIKELVLAQTEESYEEKYHH